MATDSSNKKDTLPIDPSPVLEDNVNMLKDDKTQTNAEVTKALSFGMTTWDKLDNLIFSKPVEYVKGIVTEGFTILAGKPKQGKSTLINDMILSIAAGTKVFGDLEVTKSAVALLALETSPRRLQNDIQKMSLEQRDAFQRIYTLFDWNSDLALYAGLTSIIKQHPEIKVIVIDTIGRFLDIGGGTKAGYEKRYQVGAIIKDIADEHNIAIIGVHHLKKGTVGDNPVDAIMGSSGLPAAADNIITLQRAKNSGITTLDVTGRNISDNCFHLKFDEDTRSFLSLANHPELLVGQETKTILDFLKKSTGEKSLAEIQKYIGKNKTAVSNHLHTLVVAKLVAKPGHGKYIATNLKSGSESDT